MKGRPLAVIETTVIPVLVVALLAGSVAVALAQEEGDATLEASAFRAQTGPPEGITFDLATGLERVTNMPWDATDPRASGIMSTVVARGGVCAEDRRVIDGIVDCELPSYSVSISGARLVNDGGAWLGTLTLLASEELDERTRKQRRKGRGQAPVNGRSGFLELAGEGGYEGLSLLATVSPEGAFGVILPTETLPAQPEAPFASTLVDETPRTPGEPRARIRLGGFGIADGTEASIESVSTNFKLSWADRSDNEDGFRIYRLPVRPVCQGGLVEYRIDGAPVLVDTVPPDATSARGSFGAEKVTDNWSGETTGSLVWKMAVTAFNQTGESMAAVVPDADVKNPDYDCPGR
jgi:hypothetical protein